jgi:sec-independent protein translocase protein TatA
MGLQGISFGSLLVIAFIVLMLFGTKRVRTLGEDLGEVIKGLRKSLDSSEK